MKSGIYKIVNLLNEKIYIGSSKDVDKRFKRHLRDLRKGRHHNIYLQRSWGKYGGEFFKFEVIEETADLFPREQYWIDFLKPAYNIGSVGGGDNYTHHPDKARLRLKLTETLRANPPTVSRFKELNSNWRGGKTFCACGERKANSAETCGECRDRSGKKNPFYGKSHTQDVKDKLRASHLGKPNLRDRKQILIDGKAYESATEAAKLLGVSNATITYRVKSKNYDYKYL